MVLEQVEVAGREDGLLEVTLRGTPENIVKVLVAGVPSEALTQILDSLNAEMEKRSQK